MLESINRLLGAAVPFCLLGVGIYYMVALRFFPVRRLWDIMRYFFRGQKGGEGSPLRALCLALAGTLGVGNIVGVSSAIYLGGFGAVFWMWVSALCAMILKYAEIVLAVRHRRQNEEGFYGGAPYYIKDIFSSHGMARAGGALAAIFAALCIVDAFFMGCVIQVNAVSGALESVAGIKPIFVGVALAVACFFLLWRGSGGVMAVTDRIVPLMSVGYVVVSIFCMGARWRELPEALGLIFRDAFCIESAVGGVFGFLMSKSLRFGSMRGLLSNEAGCGTSPMAHAAAKVKSPVEQGFFGLIEVFVDTILLCSMTALVVVLNYDAVASYGEMPMTMTIKAYSASFSGNATVFIEAFLAVAVLFFGFATVICWGHYGLQALGYLTKKGKGIFVALYSVFALVGALMAPGGVWGVADLAIGTMTLVNIAALCLGRREVKRETLQYFSLCDKNNKKTKKFMFFS